MAKKKKKNKKVELRKTPKSSSSSKSSKTVAPVSNKKVTKSYTTTSGEKVTKYSDGTESRSGGSNAPKVGTTAPKTTAQLLADAKTQLQGIQTGLNEGVASGQIKSGTPTPPVTPELTPEAITQAVAGATPQQEQGYTPTDVPQQQEPQQTDAQGNVIPTQGTQQQGMAGSQGGQVQQGNLTTPSVVDYLGSVGQPSDFNSRKALAGQYGIAGYTGTAQQNTQLLGALRGAPVTPQEQVTPTSAGAVAETTQQTGIGNGAVNSLATAQQKYGLTSTQDDFLSDPLKTISTITQQVFKSMGLDQANSAIKDISKELEDLENDRDDEIRAVNDDPWLTEGVRIRQIQKVEEKWADRIDSRVNRLQLLESVRDDAQQQAQFALGTAISIYDSERKFQAQQIQQYYDQAQRDFDNMVKVQELGMKSQGGSGTSEMQEYMFSVEQGFSGSFLDYKQAIAAAGRAPSSGYGGLTPAQINQNINQIAGAFDNEPIVKSYNTVLGGYNTIKSIGVNTKNPADDINFIYAFAKIMDPESVVREGEYATIQKYAQPWATTFGFNAARIGSNTNFLSPQAKQQMLNTLESKVAIVENQYNNLYNSYQQQLQAAQTGQPRSITNYAAGNQLPMGPTQPAQNYSQETQDLQFNDTGFLGKVKNAFSGLFD